LKRTVTRDRVKPTIPMGRPGVEALCGGAAIGVAGAEDPAVWLFQSGGVSIAVEQVTCT